MAKGTGRGHGASQAVTGAAGSVQPLPEVEDRIMPSYARAGGYGALASGLGNLRQMLMANRATEEDQELERLRRAEAQRMGAAAELAQPDVIPLAQGVSDYDIDPASLSAIANAAEPVAPITFTPSPRTVDVPGGTPLTVQEPAPSVTPFGNVRNPDLMRMLATADEQEDFNLRQGRITTETARLAGVAEKGGFSPEEARLVSEGIPLPPSLTRRSTTTETRAEVTADRQRRSDEQDAAIGRIDQWIENGIPEPEMADMLREDYPDWERGMGSVLVRQVKDARDKRERDAQRGGSNLTGIANKLGVGADIEALTAAPTDVTATPETGAAPSTPGEEQALEQEVSQLEQQLQEAMEILRRLESER